MSDDLNFFRRMRVSERLLAVAMLALAALTPAHSSAQSSREGSNARLQRDCPVAGQQLSGNSASNSDWAFETIRECDETGPAILASLWATPPSDAHQLGKFVDASASVLDQRLFDAVIARARSVGSPRAARVAAFRVLAMYLDASVVISQRVLENPRIDTAAITPFGASSHGIGQRQGTHQLAGTYASEIRALLQSLVNDPDPVIRQDGRNFVSWLR